MPRRVRDYLYGLRKRQVSYTRARKWRAEKLALPEIVRFDQVTRSDATSEHFDLFPRFWVERKVLSKKDGLLHPTEPPEYIPLIFGKPGQPVLNHLPPVGVVIGILWNRDGDGQDRVYIHRKYIQVIKAYGW